MSPTSTSPMCREASLRADPSEPFVARIREQFAKSHYVSLQKIGCDAVEGNFILWGSVTRYYTKQLAQTLAGSVVGIERIRIEYKCRPALNLGSKPEALLLAWSVSWTFLLLQFLSSEGGEPMLVLSRKEGERLMIGDTIVVTVVHVEGGRVKLGIEAPRDIGIQREEIRCRPSPQKASPLRSLQNRRVAFIRRMLVAPWAIDSW